MEVSGNLKERAAVSWKENGTRKSERDNSPPGKKSTCPSQNDFVANQLASSHWVPTVGHGVTRLWADDE